MYRIKASSLINAIFTCLMISVFSGCLVLISYYQNMLNDLLYTHEDLIQRNDSSFNYLISNLETVSYDQMKEIDVFGDEVLSYIQKKHWGFYDILISKTQFKNDTVTKTALVGQKSYISNNIALYVTDYDRPLKLSGKMTILGQIKVPNGKTELAYINGQKGNKLMLKGQQLKSGDKLPKIEKDVTIEFSKFKPVSLSSLGKDIHVINGFDEATKVIDVEDIGELRDMVCKGNIVLTSNNTLNIAPTASLNDVIISAPSVTIKSGFKGNIQIIAKEHVTIDENVELHYPSSIYIKNDNDDVLVEIRENSTIAGGIVIDGDIYNASLNRSLTIEENATVIGNVYCYGNTQLKGKVIGNIYTDKFFLKTESSNYENVILNGTINRDSLPSDFIELPLFKNNSNEKIYEIIKEF
ncbi:polymer-forming cytoskeletal protein [Flavivirga aquimarina]|uniref:Polymer-forming cytoskeletal protein n=1 Tax=Flavivirga aquimarina TaxID=2027862 RepID=A0ABT8W799_9FLAO|nr:polymer-forming cytoskeletal protein [Flavivirga aquimarina]MDO5968988.1 polymer-forming cytoskeletal protein [Flavivirga aquimarina]